MIYLKPVLILGPEKVINQSIWDFFLNIFFLNMNIVTYMVLLSKHNKWYAFQF